ncbi:MAG: DUF4349 domain-containing protein [Lachnospiraceae bacterium]|nr:DUF4349 domain-containing protein [Lachnospiraceae bacterium]
MKKQEEKNDKKNRKNGLCRSLPVWALTAALLMGGCGGSMSTEYQEAKAEPAMAVNSASIAVNSAYGAGDMADTYRSDGIYVEESAMTSYDEAGNMPVQGAEVQQPRQNSRKLIRNVNLDVETREFDDLLGTVTAKTNALGGYTESSYTYNGSSYNGKGVRNANMTLRIPAENLDAFLADVAAVSNIVSRNENVRDVTLDYVDLESHKNALKAEEERLLELMEQAESIEDLINIESRLSDIRYQVESMESQLRTYDNQVDYATVYLNIREVEELTPVVEQTIGEKISSGFAASLKGVGSGLENIFIGLIVNLPYIAVWAAVIFGIVLIVKGVIRGRKKKADRRKVQEETADTVSEEKQ